MTEEIERSGGESVNEELAGGAGVQERIEELLLGGKREYTRSQVAQKAGIPAERAHRLWQALGFATAGDDDVMFTERDVEAARLGEDLIGSGLVDPGMDAAVTRALGHHLSRLAEWQVQLVWRLLGEHPELARDPERFAQLIESLVPALERMQNYVWRRHLAAYTGRALLAAGQDAAARDQVIGFVDMVGYTRLTRRIDQNELVEILERFESMATDVIAEHRGNVVKMIGDEVLFVVDEPKAAAEIALELSALAERDDNIPELRTGLAYGEVLSRLGDVFGAVVNIAARLTSVARPGTILVSKELYEAIGDDPSYSLRSIRPVSVRGYRKLYPYTLRRA